MPPYIEDLTLLSSPDSYQFVVPRDFRSTCPRSSYFQTKKTCTMRPLQDQCEPTLYEDVQRLFQDDMVVSIEEFFDGFDPSPIGIASLVQVHVAKHKLSGKYVAVKVGSVLCCCLGQYLSFSFL